MSSGSSSSPLRRKSRCRNLEHPNWSARRRFLSSNQECLVLRITPTETKELLAEGCSLRHHSTKIHKIHLKTINIWIIFDQPALSIHQSAVDFLGISRYRGWTTPRWNLYEAKIAMAVELQVPNRLPFFHHGTSAAQTHSRRTARPGLDVTLTFVYPNNPCMEYYPTLGWFQVSNVGKYYIHIKYYKIMIYWVTYIYIWILITPAPSNLRVCAYMLCAIYV